jgi:hypothetical protein
MTSRDLCALNCFLAGFGSYYLGEPLLGLAAIAFAAMWIGILRLQIRALRRSGEHQ